MVKAVQRAPIETGPRSPANATIAEKPATDDMNAQQKTMENPTKAVHPKVKATKEKPRANEKVSTLRKTYSTIVMALHLHYVQLRTIVGI